MIDRERMQQWQIEREEADRQWRSEQEGHQRESQRQQADDQRKWQAEQNRGQFRGQLIAFGILVTIAVVAAQIISAFIERGSIP